MAATGAWQSGVRPTARNHPSTHAGDQDDVSYKQTPSNYDPRVTYYDYRVTYSDYRVIITVWFL